MVVGDVTTAVDLVVLGAGPGGYVTAIRAAQLGKSVVLVDQNVNPGGVCLNSGCIPLKALLSVSERYQQVSDRATLAALGIQVGASAFDFVKMQAWKQQIVERLTGGVNKLLSGRRIDLIHGLGYFMSAKEVRVEGDFGSHRFAFEQAVIAVGASPIALPELPFDGISVLTPAQALAVGEIPQKLAIWGQDYIALELATVFARLGAEVTLLIPSERALPEFEAMAVRLAMAGLRKLSVQVVTNVEPPYRNGQNICYQTTNPARTVTLPIETALVICSEGLARTDQINLHEIKLKLGDKGAIEVGPDQRTAIPYIFAVGDCTQRRPALATSAIKQAKIAAEALAGRKVAYNPQAFPQVVHTNPEIAAVGLTAEAAQLAGYQVKTGRFALSANGRALTLGADSGTAQVVADAYDDTLLGVTIVAPRAGDLIGEATLAIEMGATLTDIAEILHPHPGLGELLLESAESALGQVIHQLELTPALR